MSIVSKLIDLGIVVADAPDVSFEELGAAGYITHRLIEADVERAWNEKFGDAEPAGSESATEPTEPTESESVDTESSDTGSESATEPETGRPTKPKRGKKEDAPDIPPPPPPLPDEGAGESISI